MFVRAPGKVVLSGAYAVLHGAPAIVSAVDRYVLADSAREAEFITPEVRAAFAEYLGPSSPGSVTEQAPWFDASGLRDGERKLGLGSSAAILVASLAALEWDKCPELDDGVLRERIFERALNAHRLAQGGGSGVDVAASTFGGTRIFEKNAPLASREVALPSKAVCEVWSSGTASSTKRLLERFSAFERAEPQRFKNVLAPQMAASEAAARALESGDLEALLLALMAQCRALAGLGDALSEPIVPRDLKVLAKRAEAEGSVLLPAGAGGGDIACFIGSAPPSAELREQALRFGHTRLRLGFGAVGVHRHVTR
jgi:phosphomevalonate kinase